jgi:hypothetical protein
VLPSASTVASGVAIGVAFLTWAVESSCMPAGSPTDHCMGMEMSIGEIRDHWPRVAELLAAHGPYGALLSFAHPAYHPLPVVCFALWQGRVSAAPLMLAAWMGTFVKLSALGGAAVLCTKLLEAFYRRSFADYEPEGQPSPAKTRSSASFSTTVS